MIFIADVKALPQYRAPAEAVDHVLGRHAFHTAQNSGDFAASCRHGDDAVIGFRFHDGYSHTRPRRCRHIDD